MLEFQVDYRLGGVLRRYYGKPGHFNMFIPPELRECIVFVGNATREGNDLRGTAFFIFVENENGKFIFQYLVTAKHLLIKIKERNEENKVAQKVYLRFNFLDGEAGWISTDLTDWVFHPELLWMLLYFLGGYPHKDAPDYRLIPSTMIITEEVISRDEIGPGYDVFIMGLFTQHGGKHRNLPIVRAGHIALMPEEQVRVKDFGEIEAYLIESRSIGGLSGSPVFTYMPAGRLQTAGGGSREMSRFYLLGLVNGHYDIETAKDVAIEDSGPEEKLNTGIAIVIPASKIAQAINQPKLVEARTRRIEEFRNANLPTQD